MNATASSSSFSKLVGTAVGDGRYQLLSELGHGSFGVVFKALDNWSTLPEPQYCAVKCLRAHAPGSVEEALQQREFEHHRIVSAAGTPNVVGFHHHFIERDTLFVVLDFCDGNDLFDAIIEQERFIGRDDEIKAVFLQLIDAVHGCHQAGVFHRDLKPENVLLMADGAVKLCDFGLSTTKRVTTEFRCGTMKYMSPECMNESKEHPLYSPLHNDIWSLGVILVNMVSHRDPWYNPLSTDPLFKAACSDRHFYRRKLSMSDAANTLMTRIFSLNPLTRISLPELRNEVVAIKTFFPNGTDPALPARLAITPFIPRIIIDSYSFESESTSSEEGSSSPDSESASGSSDLSPGIIVTPPSSRAIVSEFPMPPVPVVQIHVSHVVHRSPCNVTDQPPPRRVLRRVGHMAIKRVSGIKFKSSRSSSSSSSSLSSSSSSSSRSRSA